MAAGSSSSITISEKDATLSEDEVDPSLLTGIAKRVQKRNARKRKVVSTPFTMGDSKKKIKLNLASKEKFGHSISSDTPAIAPEPAPAPTPASTPPPLTEPAPTSASELALAPEITLTPAPPPTIEPSPTSPSELAPAPETGPTPEPIPATDPEPEHASVNDVEPAADKSMIVYEVDDSKEIELRPAPEYLDYPGRSLISEDKCLFIDNDLKQFKDK
ncbi:protein TsetseEP-like [Dendrobium catenatum]|uniref:protein TsetseEP-like n=1 Tax=Dendrobium catenatum TaxID=906689 RepID=UPI0009F68B36|nr:protein TsetseEP-like [Dendrobium catenatum]